MDALSIREILSKARKKLECPRCGSTIPPQNIDLTLQEDKKCLFSAQCKKCALSFGGKIMLNIPHPSKDEKMNASSRLKVLSKHLETISSQEQTILAKQLRLGKNFTELFRSSSS